MRHLLWLSLLACNGSSSDTPPSDTGSDTGELEVPGELVLPAVVRLPQVPVGQGSEAVLSVVAVGDTQAIQLDVDGPFEVQGATEAMMDGEERSWTVRFAGEVGVAGNYGGSLMVSQGEQVVQVQLGASIVADGVPGSASWSSDAYGSWATVSLPSAPFPSASGSWTDDRVWIWVPEGLTAPFGVVTHLHGHNAELDEMLPRLDLPAQFAAAARNAVVIVPQGPVSASSGDFGKLMEPGGHANLVRDVVAVAYGSDQVDVPQARDGVVTAHSGGYRATARLLEHGGFPLVEAQLYDALYGDRASFVDAALAGVRLRSLYTEWGGTVDQNQALLSDLSTLDIDRTLDDADLRDHDVSVVFSPAGHNEVMRDRRNLQRLLQAALPPHALAPPELLAVTSSGDGVEVQWRDEGVEVVVQTSDDGQSWSDAGQGAGGVLTVPATPWLRLKQPGGWPSDAYGGGGDWLVVDGFDRFRGGSYGGHTHDFGARVAVALGGGDAASNEAVEEGRVRLSDYDRVLWLLGDESSLDRTFSDAEQVALQDYLSGGGQLIVSGSEVGFATSASFLIQLGATYVADDAGTTEAGGYTFGVTYPEDYPDVLSGQTVVWAYATGGAAAVSNGQVVVVGFPVETLEPSQLEAALAELVAALD